MYRERLSYLLKTIISALIDRGQFFRHETVFSLTLFTLFADLDAVKMASRQTEQTCYKLLHYYLEFNSTRLNKISEKQQVSYKIVIIRLHGK